MNLETPQDLKLELIESSKRGQAKQLACRPHQTHLSFFTAVEFYRQRKLPDIPRKSPIQTGLERVTERSRRTSCMGSALFAPLFSFASGIAVLTRTAAKKSTLSFVTDHSIRELAPWARCPTNTSSPTNTTLAHPAAKLANSHDMADRPSRSIRLASPIINKNSIIPLFSFCLHDECMTERGGCVLYFFWGWKEGRLDGVPHGL